MDVRRAEAVKRNLCTALDGGIGSCSGWPCTTAPRPRRSIKRKCSSSPDPKASPGPSPVPDPDAAAHDNDCDDFSFDAEQMRFSSPVWQQQDKLSDSLQQCSLFDISCSGTLTKRVKRNDQLPGLNRKSNSAPGTPQCSGVEFEHTNTDTDMKKSHSLDMTPTKLNILDGPLTSLGTPERARILYPALAERRPPLKPKSPAKFRSELKRYARCAHQEAAAKKRLLFVNRDFVRLFMRDTNNGHLVRRIWSYLDVRDLANVVRVSALWRAAVRDDRAAHRRHRRHVVDLVTSKENLATRRDLAASVDPAPTIEVSACVADPWQKVATRLPKEQRMCRCLACGSPSLLDHNIGLCTRRSCQYIWCERCGSGSAAGPDHLVCSCEKSSSPSPPLALQERSLGDISNARLSLSTDASSGYLSQSQPDSDESLNKSRTSAFSVRNKRSPCRGTPRPPTPPLAHQVAFRDVVRHCMRHKLHKKRDEDPSSPPRVAMTVIGSAKSKKSLRRLCL